MSALQQMLLGTAPAGGGGGGGSKWDPLKMGSSIVLSNSDRTATVSDLRVALAVQVSTPSDDRMFEITYDSATLLGYLMLGLGNISTNLNFFLGSDGNSWAIHADGRKFTGGSSSSFMSAWAFGDVIGFRLDAAGDMMVYKNGTLAGTAYTGFNARSVYPAISQGNGSASSHTGTLNTTGPFAFPIGGVSAWE